jgi:hypothetical protein
MIYLFEDRKDRMSVHLKTSLDNQYINSSLEISVNKNKLESFIESLAKLDAILIHKSYTFPAEDITIEDVKTACTKRDIKIALFSGGLSNAVISEDFVVVNSGDFYKNISLLQDEYKNKGAVNLPLLVFGKKYILNQVKQLQIVISQEILSNSPNDIRLFEKIIEDTQAYLTAEGIQEDKEKFIQWLHRLISDGRLPESMAVMDQIQKLANKYGNN